MSRFLVPEHVVISEVDESLVLLDMKSGKYYTFNESGADFLTAIIQGHSLSEAVQTVVKNYHQVPSNVYEDFQEHVDVLLKKGLLTESDRS